MMSPDSPVPFYPQDVGEITTLLRSLENHTKKSYSGGGKKGFSCKKTAYPVADSPKKLVVNSWRFQDWDYKRDDLPTYARGLFTSNNSKGQPEIAIRGYDKFFNIGEVESTNWSRIESDTRGPYELSLKENGCIIFISGLHDDSLLVCSKHSTGKRSDLALSHALAGERWIDKQLVALGKTRQDLARELRQRNATAVAELCDDEFEEHILAYSKDDAGLYLHGININVPEFTTYPGDQVQKFANEWGFKRTDFIVYDDISTVRGFLESVAETGSYNGRDIEGFVIRCKAHAVSGRGYRDWFFKYKFEEPYLMYRQWRECTKSLIAGRTPRYKKHLDITDEYLLYVKTRLAADRNLATAYNSNHGIIALRDDFLKEKNLKGSDIIRQEYALTGGAPGDVNKDIILLPIATIGCGKTTIAIALRHLFGWGHIQNDNITGKGRPPKFTKEVLLQLQEVPVVIADRNNAQRHEREQIIEDVHRQHGSARLVALYFVHDKQMIDNIRQVTQERVFSRGDNHQTIQAATDKQKVIGIMEGFMHRFEPLRTSTKPDDGFDNVIELDPTADSRENLETVVSQLHALYPKLFMEMPSSEDLDEAINIALTEYRPSIKHDRSNYEQRHGEKSKANKQQKFAKAAIPTRRRPLEYMSVSVKPKEVLDILGTVFDGKGAGTSKFFRMLRQTRRLQAEFHVTLMHRATEAQHPEMWARFKAIHEEAGSAENKLGDCKIQLERIVWNDRIMAIVVRILDDDWQSVNPVPHITVGTRGPEVKPKESNDLLQDWLKDGSGDQTGIGDIVISGGFILDGTVHGVLSR